MFRNQSFVLGFNLHYFFAEVFLFSQELFQSNSDCFGRVGILDDGGHILGDGGLLGLRGFFDGAHRLLRGCFSVYFPIGLELVPYIFCLPTVSVQLKDTVFQLVFGTGVPGTQFLWGIPPLILTLMVRAVIDCKFIVLPPHSAVGP